MFDKALTPNPINKEKTIICSISPSAIDLIGLEGKMLTNTSFREGAEGAENSISVDNPIPLPVSNKLAKDSANAIAIEVVAKYRQTAFMLMDPSFDEFSI